MSESVRAIEPSIKISARRFENPAIRPTLKEWSVHTLLFSLTVITTTFAGIVNAAPDIDPAGPPLASWLDYILYIPVFYGRVIGAVLSEALRNPHLLAAGLTFSATLLAILTAHEMGHYIACRKYGVSATLPFFIPAPPLFLAGTFGAFIKIRSPLPTRRVLFDVGLAGPLAGFIVLLPIAIIGVLNIGPPLQATGHEIIFNDPLLLRLLAKALGVRLDPYSPTNPCYMAAWIGLLVTSLNLMPVGQLDGGHGTFAIFGQHVHRVVGRTAFFIMAVISVLGFVWHGSPSGFLYVVLLAVMLRVRHPKPEGIEPLGLSRQLIAIATLLVFALSFWPFPITIR
jgi:membrane-associated protease RseP (regulator of RpoE activity)